ncbi:hypothetical protein GCM10022207_28970 [Streptomyces lannensis]|uniref:Uncharacterized protein n=1 Tax=Streptomyces lannensis TaxID=766498 RepID=A0ABP7K3E3_9ACTN
MRRCGGEISGGVKRPSGLDPGKPVAGVARNGLYDASAEVRKWTIHPARDAAGVVPHPIVQAIGAGVRVAVEG